jgi:hypothetical protein
MLKIDLDALDILVYQNQAFLSSFFSDSVVEILSKETNLYAESKL